MNKTVVYVCGILAFTFLFTFYIWASNNRFYISSGEKGIAYEIDRKTGETWVLAGGQKRLQKNPETEAMIAEALQEKLPDAEVKKITGNAGFVYGVFSGKLYNGSNWVIKRVVFTVKANNKNGSARWVRDLSAKVTIDPLETDSFSETITGEEGASLGGWMIKDVYGTTKADLDSKTEN